MPEEPKLEEQVLPKDKDMARVLEKINKAESILVAMSNNPSVDELAAAIGLTMSLEMKGKHVTAIYSGKTPNALQFLEPEKTFEANTNSLQDFVIALSKDKADHIQYKIEGEFVKVYITPYRTTISESDLEFTHGDYNVDLVISMSVPAVEDLDAALVEYGRIMHDASSVNITNGIPGKFCEVEWDDEKASSVSEMVWRLIKELHPDQAAPRNVATAILTGIVAATDRFSNSKTTPETMAIAAQLMESGADQQLISTSMDSPAKMNVVENPAAVAAPEISEEKELSGTSAEAELVRMLEENVNANNAMEELQQAAPEIPEMEPQPVEPVVPQPIEPVAPVEIAEPPVIEPQPMEPIATPVEPVVPAEPVTEMPIDYSEQIEQELAAPVSGAVDINNPVVAMTPAAAVSRDMAPLDNNFAATQAAAMSAEEMMQPAMQPGMQQVEVQPAGMMGAQPVEEPMPTPEVEIAPPPALQPEFGDMPPEMPQVAPGIEQRASIQSTADINPVVIQPETMGPVDPSAFKIPEV